MYYNRFPERNIGLIPYVHEILRILDSERLAIEPIQLNLKLEGDREMKSEIDILMEWQGEDCDRSTCIGCGYHASGADGMCSHPEYLKLKEDKMKTVEVENKGEIDQAKRKAILHHKLSSCPQCGIGDLWAVCTVKNFDTGDYSPECDHCSYVDNK